MGLRGVGCIVGFEGLGLGRTLGAQGCEVLDSSGSGF